MAHGKQSRRKMKSEVFSIFGQIESVVADAMVREGSAVKIEPHMIPASMRFDGRGRKAYCALVMNRQQAAEFDRRVALLYA